MSESYLTEILLFILLLTLLYYFIIKFSQLRKYENDLLDLYDFPCGRDGKLWF